MKSNIKVFLMIFTAIAFMFSACNKSEDLVTKDALTGGLITPTSSIPYKLGATPVVSIAVTIPMGPGIASIEVYNTYTDVAAKAVSAQVLMKTVDVASANLTEEVSKPYTLTYADLIKGITIAGKALPANEALLAIGNSWELSYVSVLSDGRKVLNNAKTTIAVANKYAGFYQSVGYFTHPTPTSSRAINEKKFLTPLTAYACRIPAGDLGSSGYNVVITVDPATNTVAFSGGVPTDMFASATRSYFDPATGKFYLHYFYVGASGNRVMDEVLTPLP
jgi:hypothetical protein